ncbi:MAG: AAA family ATPase [Acidobacteria bacterium]|nr:AAA family ATPase [Acidobacteriota bacterium]
MAELHISPEFVPFISHLSDLARSRERMPFVGRETELEALMETLQRKLKKNIILVGKPGVGKTALVTELADRINRGEVPANLRGKVILELSLTSFFYSRESADLLAKDFEKLLAEVRRNGHRVILFLDELHGWAQGRGGQIQGLLRAHIADRELLVIAAAAPEVYAKHIKSDEIMAANFSAILLNEPEKEEMLTILRGVKRHFEGYYGLVISDALFESVYSLSLRFIPTRAFPDKAIELLDISCSKAALKKASALDREHVFQSISDISRLPIAIIRLDPQAQARGLLDFLQREVVNQASALEEIARIIKLARLETRANVLKPEGIFLFLGPTGVGKSFIAAKIAAYLFGGPEKLRVIDLAGFKKPEDAERLVRGDDEGGSGPLLREIESHPFAVILFENIEEAHSAVLYALGKILTKGEVVDPLGKRHCLANLIFILSLTEIGEERKGSAIGFVRVDPSSGQIIIAPKIMNVLDWVDEIIQFTPLTPEHLQRITAIQMAELRRDLGQRYRCRLDVDDEVLQAMANEAEKSGRFAHAIAEFIEREVRLPAVDLVTRTDRELRLRVMLEDGRVRIVAE